MRIQTIATLKEYTDSQKPITWSMIEIHIGCVIACIPTYTPLLKKLGGKISRGYSHTMSRSQGLQYIGGRTLGTSATVRSERGGAQKLGPGESDGSGATAADDEIALWDTRPEKGDTRVWVCTLRSSWAFDVRPLILHNHRPSRMRTV